MQLTYTVGSAVPTNLWQLVQDYCETNEVNFLADIPTFVKAAEARIYNSVNLPALRNNVTGVTTSNNKYMAVPTGWLATYSLAVITPGTGVYTYLLDKDVNFIREAYPDPTATGIPAYYALFDADTFLLGPTPDQVYTTELHYRGYPVSIVTATNTWLGDNFADVLLYGTIREAYTYLKGEADLMQSYEAKYQESLALLKQMAEGSNRQDAYRNGQFRMPVQ